MGSLGTSIASSTVILNEFVQGLKKAVSSAVHFGKQAVQSFSHFQQLESSLQGLMRSEEKGTELFEHLRSFSFDTTFGVDTLASASQQLLGIGIAVEDLDSTLMMIGNVAQGDTQKFNELVGIFAKIQNQGKASSVQLQQLALRGVPIYQMLKQIGVEGKATGADITKAFEMMTSEGGQFEGAMERINNTIQGREGFVSDTWREFLTSFAEATGIADLYAKALDVVYNALQGIVDWLQKINENPLYQALFRGALTLIIGGLVTMLSTKLIGAFAMVITKLKAMFVAQQALNLATGNYVQFGVAMAFAVAGVGVAIKGVSDAIEKNNEVIDDQLSLEERMAKAEELAMSTKLEDQKVHAQMQIYALYEQLEDEVSGYSKEEKLHFQTEIEYFQNKINKINEMIKLREKEKQQMQEMNALVEQSANHDKVMETVNKLYEKTDKGGIESLQNQIAELKAERNSMKTIKTKDYYGNTVYAMSAKYTEEEKKRIDEVSKYLEEQLKKAIEKSVNLSEWQKVMKQAFGFDDKKNSFLKTGATAIAEYDRTNKANALTSNTMNEMLAGKGIMTSSEVVEANAKEWENLYENAVKAYQMMKESGQWEDNEESMISMISLINEYANKSKELKGQAEYEKELETIQNETKLIGLQNEELYKQQYIQKGISEEEAKKLATMKKEYDEAKKKADLKENAGKSLDGASEYLNANGHPVAGAMVGAMANTTIGQAVNAGMQGAQTGGFWGAFIAVIMSLVKDLQGFNRILKFAGKLLNVLLKPLDMLFNWIADLLGMEDDVADEKEKELEQLKKLNEQYQNLSYALDEQNQYYAEMRKQLANETNKRYLETRSVNDMIITPQGNFSTHPDDYIMAMKKPTALMGGGGNMNVIINDYASDVVSVKANTNDRNELVLSISKKIANDYVTGANGWDVAYNSKQRKLNGTAYSR